MVAKSPAYEVLRHDDSFELRRYDGYLTASVHVSAPSHEQATNAGFNALADYIFGNNRGSDHIAMTAPVSAGRVCCQKIAMTVPVTATQSEDEYVVSFTMPSEYSMDDLPRPNNPSVALESVAPHTVAAIRFGGHLNKSSFAQALADLEAWMGEQGLTPAGEPVSAQYDAPWKPGFARRNEILIPTEAIASDPQ